MFIAPSSRIYSPRSAGAQQRNVPLLRSGLLDQAGAINISPLRGGETSSRGVDDLIRNSFRHSGSAQSSLHTNISGTIDECAVAPRESNQPKPADAARLRVLRRSVRSTRASGRRHSADIDCWYPFQTLSGHTIRSYAPRMSSIFADSSRVSADASS